jgi:hypothetical protein
MPPGYRGKTGEGGRLGGLSKTLTKGVAMREENGEQRHQDEVCGRGKLGSWQLYRTRWLLAHNCAHDMACGSDRDKRWTKYLEELGTAESVARTPA